MGDKRARPVLIGPFSGPVHGVSSINNALRSIMRECGLEPGIIDLSPGSHPRGLSYHLTRSARAFTGAIRVLTARLGGRYRYVMSLDGGGGLIYNILLAMVLRVSGQAVCFYHHSSRYVLADSRLMRMLLSVSRKAPQIFCSPAMARQFVARYGDQGEIFVINNAAWIFAVPISQQKRDAALVRLGFLSALNLEKGLGRAIETLRLLRRQGVPARLELAGAVSDRQAASLLEEAGREFGVDLINRGVLQGPEKSAFLAGLDYFLFPSLYTHETQSLVVPEALSAAVPVIAFDHRFVGEVMGEGGLLISAGDDFAVRATDWITGGQEVLDQRRRQARAQFEAEHAKAAGQVQRLIRWSVGES